MVSNCMYLLDRVDHLLFIYDIQEFLLPLPSGIYFQSHILKNQIENYCVIQVSSEESIMGVGIRDKCKRYYKANGKRLVFSNWDYRG